MKQVTERTESTNYFESYANVMHDEVLLYETLVQAHECQGRYCPMNHDCELVSKRLEPRLHDQSVETVNGRVHSSLIGEMFVTALSDVWCKCWC